MSALSAFCSDLATTVGPIARACGATPLARGGLRRSRDVVTREGVGEGLAIFPNHTICVAHHVSPISVDLIWSLRRLVHRSGAVATVRADGRSATNRLADV